MMQLSFSESQITCQRNLSGFTVEIAGMRKTLEIWTTPLDAEPLFEAQAIIDSNFEI